MRTDVKTVVDGFHYLECPRWHEDRVWFSDFYSHAVFSVRESGEDLRVEAKVNQPSGIGWLPDGRLLVVSMRDFRVLRREADGQVVTHADLRGHVTGYPNDMVVDREGRAFVGHLGFDVFAGDPLTTASLLRVDPNGSVSEAASDVWFPNGSVLTTDGRLLVCETFGNRISSFRFTNDGELGERADWAVFGELPVSTGLAGAIAELDVGPDGCCLDADGALWVADALGQRLLYVAATGTVVEEIPLEVGVFACMLGGYDGRTLFVCCAPDFDEGKRTASAEASLLSLRVAVPHAGLP